MSTQHQSPGSPKNTEGRLEFVAEKTGGWQAGLLLAGGIVLGLLLIATFLLMLSSPSHSPYMPGVIGGASVAPIFMIGLAIVRLRNPLRVVVDARGLLLERRITPLFIRWSDIAEVARDRTSEIGGQNPKDVLILRGEGGRVLARIVGTLPRLPALVAEVESRSALARGAPTYDRDRSIEQRRRKARRGARLLVVAGVIFAPLGLFVAGQSLNTLTHKRSLAREGVDVEARIVRHYRYNITPHLEYAFEDAHGRTFQRDVVMEPAAWEALAGAETASVRYLPSDPDWSIIEGEEIATPEGPPIIIAGALCTLMGVGFFVLGVLGIDLRVEGGKLKFKRICDIGDDLLPDSGSASVPEARPAAPVRTAMRSAPLPAATSRQPYGFRILGTLNIVFGLLGTAVNAFRLWIVSTFAGKTWTQGEMSFQFPEANRWVWLQHGTNLALAVILLLSGIALLASWPSGRRLALTAAVGQVITGLIAVAAAIYLATQGTDDLPADDRIGVIARVVGALIVELLGLVYPTILLILLGRRPRSVIQPDSRMQARP